MVDSMKEAIPDIPPNFWHLFLRVPEIITRRFASFSAFRRHFCINEGPFDNLTFIFQDRRYKILRVNDPEEHEYGWAIVLWHK